MGFKVKGGIGSMSNEGSNQIAPFHRYNQQRREKFQANNNIKRSAVEVIEIEGGLEKSNESIANSLLMHRKGA